MSRITRFRAPATLLAAMLLLTSCGSDSSDKADEADTESIVE